MKRNLVKLGVLFAIFALVGCSDTENPAVPDSGTKDDGSQTDGTGKTDGTGGDTTSSQTKDYVFNKMTVPTSATEAQKYAFDYNNDSKKDNALGDILAALMTAVPGMDLQGELDQNMRNGRAILLVKVTARDLASDDAAKLQGWTGEETTCCTTKPCSEADANKSCFSGTHAFKVSAQSPQNAVLNGKIAASMLEVGPGEMEVLLPIGKYPAKVMLKQARIKASISGTNLADGVLMGVVTKSDIDNNVVPSVAKVLDGELKDPTTKQTVKDAIKQAFDTNNDGTIDTGEVADNGLIKALLAGDVDVDNDGTKELSAGVGFSAVTCKINP